MELLNLLMRLLFLFFVEFEECWFVKFLWVLDVYFFCFDQILENLLSLGYSNRKWFIYGFIFFLICYEDVMMNV